MKFFIYSVSGDGAGLAYKLQEEGHEVYIYIKENFFRPILDGMVDHVSSVQEGLLKEPDLIVFDMSGEGKLADSLRKKGYHVIGAGAFNDKIEMDRTHAMELAKEHGLHVPEYTCFKSTDVQKAIEFLQETQGRYVLKPHGNLALDMTYVAKDAEDMIQILTWAESKGIMKGDFLLQEFVDGIEISTECWFSNGKLIPGMCNGTIEQKKLMTGNKGPATGCEASVVWPYLSDSAKAVKETLQKLYPLLEKEQYHGPIDVNSIIDKKDGKAYFLEFTPRLGYSAFYTLCELLPKEQVGDFLVGLDAGDEKLELDGGVATCITISIPPYPLDSSKEENHKAFKLTEGKRILNIPPKGFWPYDVKFDDNDIVTAGTLALVGYFTNWGMTVESSMEELYEQLDEIVVPNAQYRVDGAERAMKDIPKLDKFDYEVPTLK